MQTKHTSSSPNPPRSLPIALGLALFAAAFVATAGLPPDEQPKPEPQQPPVQPAVTNTPPPQLTKMHAEQLRRFATTPGFGLSRTLDLPARADLKLAGVNQYVLKPDLIALESKPIAYRSLGRGVIGMAALTNRTLRAQLHSRPVTDDEARAIIELRSGKELVQRTIKVTPEPGKPATGTATLVLGAMRASGACAKCHEVPEGTLLGAFSYTLRPTEVPAAARIPDLSPAAQQKLGLAPSR